MSGNRATFTLKARYRPIVEAAMLRLGIPSHGETIEKALDHLMSHNPAEISGVISVVIPEQLPKVAQAELPPTPPQSPPTPPQSPVSLVPPDPPGQIKQEVYEIYVDQEN